MQEQTRETGHIRNFVKTRGFGFIERQNEAGVVFFHVHDVDNLADEDELRPGVSVAFAVENNPKGTRAVDVELLAGASAEFQPAVSNKQTERPGRGRGEGRLTLEERST